MKEVPFDLDLWKTGKYICKTHKGAIVSEIIDNREKAKHLCYELLVEFSADNNLDIVPTCNNYYIKGNYLGDTESLNDLILIPKENKIMEVKEIKITPPEGLEIDKENSTFECIKFKPIKRWADDTNVKLAGYIIDSADGSIHFTTGLLWNVVNAHHVFATKKQAKSALAMARISQIMANDERFGGIVTDKEWGIHSEKYCITRNNSTIICTIWHNVYHFLAFHTSEQRGLFLKENKDLVKDYLMI